VPCVVCLRRRWKSCSQADGCAAQVLAFAICPVLGPVIVGGPGTAKCSRMLAPRSRRFFQLSLSRKVEDAKPLHPQAMVQLTDESLKIRALKSWKDKLDKLTAGCSRRKNADAELQDGEEDGNGEGSKKKKTSKPKGLADRVVC
jgi:hypothetical protein